MGRGGFALAMAIDSAIRNEFISEADRQEAFHIVALSATGGAPIHWVIWGAMLFMLILITCGIWFGERKPIRWYKILTFGAFIIGSGVWGLVSYNQFWSARAEMDELGRTNPIMVQKVRAIVVQCGGNVP